MHKPFLYSGGGPLLYTEIKYCYDRLYRMIKSFIHGGQFGQYKTENYRQIEMFKTLCFIGVIFFAIFGTIMILDHKWILAVMDFCMIALLTVLFSLIEMNWNPKKIQLFGILCLGAFFIFIFFNKQANGLGFFWYYSYPLAAAFLLGARMGTLLTTLLIIATLFLIPLVDTNYSFPFLSRFFPSYLAVGLLSYVYEQTRAHTEDQLILNNQRLNFMVHELSMTEKSYRESRQKYRDLVETVQDWIWEIDAEGRFTFSSPQVKHILGYEPEEMIGKKPAEFSAPESFSEIEQSISEIMSQKQNVMWFEGVSMHRRGHRVVLETNGVPISDEHDELLGYRCVTRDVTIRKNAQEEHSEREKLQGALELAGAVCHELNQPMMAISGYVELLMDGEDTAIDPAVANSLSKIRGQAERMGAITRKLMSITRYETCQYSGGGIIIDIDRSSSADSSPQGPRSSVSDTPLGGKAHPPQK